MDIIKPARNHILTRTIYIKFVLHLYFFESIYIYIYIYIYAHPNINIKHTYVTFLFYIK